MKQISKRILAVLFFCCFYIMMLSPSYLGAEDQQKELSLHYYRGVVNFEAGRYDNALVEFQAVIATDPYYKDAQQYMEHCVKMLEQYRRDLYKTEEKGSLEKKDVDLYFVGKSYYEKGDFRHALEVFKAVLVKNPEDKFAQYYAQLCKNRLGAVLDKEKVRLTHEEKVVANIDELEKEVSYIKSDINDQQSFERFLETKAERKNAREELIKKKERQLKEQEELLEEERQDYLAQEKISKRTEKIKQETEKWKNMKARLESEQPGVPAALIEFPLYFDRAQGYYRAMKEALRTSRWNSAGLNAINAGIYYCDALLIYHYGVKSAVPSHDNINRLILTNVKRADVDENVFHLRAILNLKNIIEDEDRPLTRSEALFLAGHADKIVEWCRSLLP